MQGIESDIFFLLLSLATLFCTFYKFIVPASPDLVDNLYLFYDLKLIIITEGFSFIVLSTLSVNLSNQVTTFSSTIIINWGSQKLTSTSIITTFIINSYDYLLIIKNIIIYTIQYTT